MRVDHFVTRLNNFKTTLLNHPLSNEISPLSDHPNYSTKTLSPKNIGVSDGNSQQMIHLIESLQAILSLNESHESIDESLQEFNQKIETLQNQIDELFKDDEFISKRFKSLFQELSKLVISMESLSSSKVTKFLFSSTYKNKIEQIESICDNIIDLINTWMCENIASFSGRFLKLDYHGLDPMRYLRDGPKGTKSRENEFSDMAIFQSHRFDDASDRDYVGSNYYDGAGLKVRKSDDNRKGINPRVREPSQWDKYRSDNKGRGLSRSEMSKLYNDYKKGDSLDDNVYFKGDSLHPLSSIHSLNSEGEIPYTDPGDSQFDNIYKVSSKVPSRSRPLPSGSHEVHQMAVFSSDEPEFLWNSLYQQVENSEKISSNGKYSLRVLYDDLLEIRSNLNDVQVQLTFDGAIINIYDHMKPLTLSRTDRAEFFNVILRLVKKWRESEESVLKATLIEQIVKPGRPSAREDESFNQFLEKSPFALISDVYVRGLSKIADDVRRYLYKLDFNNLENQLKSDFIEKFCSRDHRGIVMVYRTDFKENSLKSAILDSLKDQIRLNDPKNLEMIIPELNQVAFPLLVRLYLKEEPITLGEM